MLIRVIACGICRTDLHVVDGELPGGKLPVVPGHEVIGTVAAVGGQVKTVQAGQTVGLGWFSGSCLTCPQCMSGNHNLCASNEATIVGRHGTPMYVYDGDMVADRYERVRQAFPSFEVFYSLKANPSLALTGFLRTLGAGAEIASGGELFLDRRNDVRRHRAGHGGDRGRALRPRCGPRRRSSAA